MQATVIVLLNPFKAVAIIAAAAISRAICDCWFNLTPMGATIVTVDLTSLMDIR